MPPSAIDAGADISVQSTHKLAGGLQQTGLIHRREDRVDSELMEEAFREYVTTSPSYHLLASADAAVRHLDDPGWVGRHYAYVAGCDKVKTTVALSGYAISGFALSEALVERGIVVEKAGVNTLTLITTFQLEDAAVEATVSALEEILAGRELEDGARKPMPANPFRAIDDRPVMHPARDLGGAIVARDTSLATLRVL